MPVVSSIAMQSVDVSAFVYLELVFMIFLILIIMVEMYEEVVLYMLCEKSITVLCGGFSMRVCGCSL